MHENPIDNQKPNICQVAISKYRTVGSAEFVRSYAAAWQMERQRRHPPKMNRLKGAEWGDLAVIRGLRKAVFS
ncbi:MAG TPA: hypothetical protein DEA90_12185 [Opitutae bacterium]|nr:hypothetical protein [Puniceicoccaceae bacterium]HBR94911.1 hypothetical protein [Opitutae bacterium]